ncbi:MAG: Leucine-rich repeat (LRR) protein [Patiriisocius sp.]|jgi:Leucine-rich repeat (LRR) protein
MNFLNMKKLLLLLACAFLTLPTFSQPFDSDPDKTILQLVWNDMNQPALAGWDFDHTVELNDTWEGITMTGDGINISALELANKDLTGIVSPELSSLTNLTELSLNDNQLSGSIPAELSTLSNLTSLTFGKQSTIRQHSC